MSKLLKTIINGVAVYTVAKDVDLLDDVVHFGDVEIVDSTPELEALVAEEPAIPTDPVTTSEEE